MPTIATSSDSEVSLSAKLIRQKLHEMYRPGAYDNSDIWAGNLAVRIDGILYPAQLARVYAASLSAESAAVVQVEFYVAGIDLTTIEADDIQARVWTDANDRGYLDADRMHRQGFGQAVSMRALSDGTGRPLLTGNNLTFVSDPIPIRKTGVFSYTVEMSADRYPVGDKLKQWVALNDIAHNQDGVICSSPGWVRECPSIAEVCIGKVGASVDGDTFRSGTISDVTQLLDQIPASTIYLLPFFEPGFEDSFTGEDVRKGELGSPYAVRDFFRIDPRLVPSLESIDFGALVQEGLVVAADLTEVASKSVVGQLRLGEWDAVKDALGEDGLVQLAGRAELRRLTRKAHELGKRVVFDLVLKQTSRDCSLIDEHPDWYVQDDAGRPRIHQIAWLIYSDVALLDLTFNWPLQSYLSSVAPHWIDRCGFDGVRIDASQTLDRPFLKQIKNRINAAKPEALVLGETLCALEESKDIPVDMVYALLVDFHRDVHNARPYIDFLEETSGSFPPRTVAMAYFENHDSPRATRIWRERYAADLAENESARIAWSRRAPDVDEPLMMALLRNLQASLIDATAGSATHTNLAYGMEMGTWWGEEESTDFENPTLQHPERADEDPNRFLVKAYRHLHADVGRLAALKEGRIYFHRNDFNGGDPDDRVLAYTRHGKTSAVLVVHNLDPCERRTVTCPVGDALGVDRVRVPNLVMDTYAWMNVTGESEVRTIGSSVEVTAEPLQSVVVSLGASLGKCSGLPPM